jgi:hypothetical protein
MGNSLEAMGVACKCVENQTMTKSDPAFETVLQKVEAIYELSAAAVKVIESVHNGGSLNQYREMQENMLVQAQAAIADSVFDSWDLIDVDSCGSLKEYQCRVLMEDYCTSLRKWMPKYCMRVFKFRASAIALSVRALTGAGEEKVAMDSHFSEKNKQAEEIARQCCQEKLNAVTLVGVCDGFLHTIMVNAQAAQWPSRAPVELISKSVFCDSLIGGAFQYYVLPLIHLIFCFLSCWCHPAEMDKLASLRLMVAMVSERIQVRITVPPDMGEEKEGAFELTPAQKEKLAERAVEDAARNRNQWNSDTPPEERPHR